MFLNIWNKVSNVASQTGKRSGRKQEILMFTPCWRMVSFFSFFIMSLYSMLVRILNEALSVIAREKQVKLRAGEAWKCLHFGKRSVLKGIHFVSSCFSPGAGSCLQWRGVCNSEGYAGRESTVDQSKFGIVSFSTLAKDGIKSACGKNKQ